MKYINNIYKAVKMFSMWEKDIHALRELSNFKMNETQIFDANSDNAIQIAVNCLKRGCVIALPTDTVYGLACIANDPIAIQKLYAIKSRENTKPVSICVADTNDVKFWGKANHIETSLLNRLLPGPVTVVLEKSHNLENPYLNPGVTKIGIRIPDYQFIQELCKQLRLPLALTSANKSKEKSSLNINEFKELWPRIYAVFDGGQLGTMEEQRSASTVVDLCIPGKYSILRAGVAVVRTTDILKQYNYYNIIH